MSKLITANAEALLKARYLHEGENFQDLCKRVSSLVASPEKNRKDWEKKFFKRMIRLEFLPNTPTLVNAGKPKGQLSACFVLPVGSNLKSIMDSLKGAALVHQSGGGTGFSFSKAGRDINTASVLDILELFDKSTDLIKQGGVRRGANMGVLSIRHPEIENFVKSKSTSERLQNFNISVSVDNAFMVSALSGSRESKQREFGLLELISENAWKTGDPGLIFIDRMNLFNPTPEYLFEATNPCGEQPLLSYESCNLGSINLMAFIRGEKFEWNQFRKCIWESIRFLDNVIDVNDYPLLSSQKITLKNRKIGLGIMGFADSLVALGLKYTSKEALQFAHAVGSLLQSESRQASSVLAKEKGAFPSWKSSLWKQLGFPPLRNATVTTIAPTGSISVIAGVSSGIEPRFSLQTTRTALDGKAEFREDVLSEMGRFTNGIKKNWKNLLVTALDVPIECHIKVQAVFQQYSDSAVSKTVNMRNDAKISDVLRAYQLAFEYGCKGVTIFRDGCRDSQILKAAPINSGSNSRIRCESC